MNDKLEQEVITCSGLLSCELTVFLVLITTEASSKL